MVLNTASLTVLVRFEGFYSKEISRKLIQI